MGLAPGVSVASGPPEGPAVLGAGTFSGGGGCTTPSPLVKHAVLHITVLHSGLCSHAAVARRSTAKAAFQ